MIVSGFAIATLIATIVTSAPPYRGHSWIALLLAAITLVLAFPFWHHF